jgi:hypothetical protein
MKIIPARSTAQFATGLVMFKGEGPGSCNAATAIRGLATWVQDEYGPWSPTTDRNHLQGIIDSQQRLIEEGLKHNLPRLDSISPPHFLCLRLAYSSNAGQTDAGDYWTKREEERRGMTPKSYHDSQPPDNGRLIGCPSPLCTVDVFASAKTRVKGYT